MFYMQETRMVQHYIKWRETDMVFEDSAITIRQDKGRKGNKTGKEEVKLFLFPDYRILFLNNPVV